MQKFIILYCMTKCPLLPPNIHKPLIETKSIVHIACTSFLATSVEKYSYSNNKAHLFNFVLFSFLSSHDTIYLAPWETICTHIFTHTTHPALIPYKSNLKQTLELIKQGCHDTVEIICSPIIRASLYTDIASHPDLLPDKKIDIKQYLDTQLCYTTIQYQDLETQYIPGSIYIQSNNTNISTT